MEKFYCEHSIGKFLMNCTVPDGAVIKADGAKVFY